jgi:hypothetical protein
MQPLEDIQSNFSTVSASLQPPALPVSSSAGPSGNQGDPLLSQWWVEKPPPFEQSFLYSHGVIMCAEDNCEETFRTMTESKKHRDKKHTKPIRCNLCTHRTATRTDIRKHLETHRPYVTRMRFPCPELDCDKTFTKKCNLGRHLEKQHGKSKKDSSLG